jgi:beta-carotene hydroxylase
MEKQDNTDLLALEAAKQSMGDFAWPTVLLGIVLAATYVATPILVVAGIMPLIAAVPLMAFITYAAYTVLHDAAHGSISGSNSGLRWINETLGYIAAWIIMMPMTAHRHEHLAHHRHTNQPDDDPDFVVADMTRSPFHAARAAARIYLGQFNYYFRNRWHRGPRSQNVYLCLEIAAAIAPRLAFVAAGFWLEGVALFAIAWLLGISVLMFLFAYIVHTPHESVGRYVDTTTFVIDGPLGRLITLLWGYQNYHSIHHLFPRVPFYRYRVLFDEIEPIMRARGAPIRHLGIRGLQASDRPGLTH